MYEAYISKHLNQLLKNQNREKINKLLERCELQFDGTNVQKKGGGRITELDCFNYKQTIREIFGESIYSFTKANFILAGCQCLDCKSGF